MPRLSLGIGHRAVAEGPAGHWVNAPARRDVRVGLMRRDREDELDLADIGGETGAATYGASIAAAGTQAQVIRTAFAPWSRSHLGLWFDIGLRFDIRTAYRCQRWRTSKICLFGKFFGFFPLVILMF